MTVSDDLLRRILSETRTIALVGFSANPARPSHGVARYLQGVGYRVIPVNPGLTGQVHLGEEVRGDLASVPDAVDMVDIFRRSEAVPEIVEAALARWPDLRVVWMQIGVRHATAAAAAEARGVAVVQDRCTKIDHARLIGRVRADG